MAINKNNNSLWHFLFYKTFIEIVRNVLRILFSCHPPSDFSKIHVCPIISTSARGGLLYGNTTNGEHTFPSVLKIKNTVRFFFSLPLVFSNFRGKNFTSFRTKRKARLIPNENSSEIFHNLSQIMILQVGLEWRSLYYFLKASSVIRARALLMLFVSLSDISGWHLRKFIYLPFLARLLVFE